MRHESARGMDIARRTFTHMVLAAAAAVLCPVLRRARPAVRRVRYAERPHRGECRGVPAPLAPEETARPGAWIG